jgi:hypothetical protein
LALAALQHHVDVARLEAGNQRGVTRRDAQLAQLAGGDNHHRIAVKDLGFGTDDVATNGAHNSLASPNVSDGKDLSACLEPVHLRGTGSGKCPDQAAFLAPISSAFLMASSMPPTM